VLVFTWNVGRKESALRLAINYLKESAKSDEVIATLQELPPKPTNLKSQTWVPSVLLDANALASDGLQLLGRVGPGRAAIIVSSGVTPDGKMRKGSGRRFLYAPLRYGKAEIAVLALHAISRKDPRGYTDFQRGSHAALTRRTVDKVWDQNRPLILLGDFNAGFKDEEIRAREGFYLLSQDELDHVLPRHRRHYGRTSPPLENLMRRIHSSPLRGSYRYQHDGFWYIFDQIAVSQDLGPRVIDFPVIRGALLGQSLLTKYGNPDKVTYSDHLPVEVKIKF